MRCHSGTQPAWSRALHVTMCSAENSFHLAKHPRRLESDDRKRTVSVLFSGTSSGIPILGPFCAHRFPSSSPLTPVKHRPNAALSKPFSWRSLTTETIPVVWHCYHYRFHPHTTDRHSELAVVGNNEAYGCPVNKTD